MRKAWLLMSVAIVGCSQVDSDNVETDGIYADLSVTADGDGNSEAKAILKVGGALSNTFLDLTADDVLWAQTGSSNLEMDQEGLFGALWYSATFNTDAADTAFRIAFMRASKESAPASDVTLPEPFAITSPSGAGSYSRTSDPVVISWSNPGLDPMTLTIGGSCFRAYNEDLNPDAQTYTLNAAALQHLEGAEDQSCDATVTVRRSRHGTIDPAFGDGTIEARQIRSVSFTSTP